MLIGADDIPKSLDQCWVWCDKWLPSGKQFHVLGVAAIAGPSGRLAMQLVLKERM